MNEKTASELPQRWVWTTLGEIAIWGSGGTPLKSKSGYYGGNIPWLKIGDLNEGLVSTSKDMITQDGLENSSAKWVEKGSLLVAMYGSIGKLGIAGINLTTNQAIAFTKLDESLLNTKFVFWYIYSIRSELFNRSKGATQKNISQTVLKKIAFPLPPLPEQHRIVTKVEELFTQLDAGVGVLTKAKAQLKRYRQSVLKSACEGRLVPTEAELARDDGRDYEPADVLLERIQKKRRKKWGAEKKRKGRKSAKYKEPAAPDAGGLPGLPEGWRWFSLDQLIIHIVAGKSFKCVERPPDRNEIGVVKVSAVTWGEFDESASKTCKNSEMVRDDFLIEEGDFLFSRANTIELVGACVIVKQISKRLMLSDKILRFGFAVILPKWVLVNLRTVFGRSEIERLATGNQDSMRNIGQDRIRQIRIPLPPLPEQHRIVAEIERRLSVADETEKTIDQSLKQAERLRQSILKRAFEGKLVPQDPNDEPASVLLEQILLQKGINEKNNKSKRGKTRGQKNR
jgi:type I restriction enzyme S subunit